MMACRKYAIASRLLHTDVRDISFIEEAMADHVSRAMTVRLAKELD